MLSWAGWGSEAVSPLPSCRSDFFHPHKRPGQSCLGEPRSPGLPGTENSSQWPWLLSYLNWSHLLSLPQNSPRIHFSRGMWACLSPWNWTGEVHTWIPRSPGHPILQSGRPQQGFISASWAPVVLHLLQIHTVIRKLFGQSWLLLICANFSL